MRVTMTQGEIEVCTMLAQMRNKNHVPPNRYKVSNKTQLEQDIEGVIGEYAFCKFKNIWPDLSTHSRQNGYDCIYNNYRVDVKATKNTSGMLLLSPKKDNPDIDIYVLAILHPFHVELVGWAFKTDLQQPENLKDLGYGPTYALTQSQLRNFKEDLKHEQLQTTAQVSNATATNAVR